jgi:hypothetical protein
MNGKGSFDWPDKKHFEGSYVDDRKEGYGEFFWSEAKYYKGNWKNGFQQGEGILYEKDKETKGVWENGKLVTVISETDVQ